MIRRTAVIALALLLVPAPAGAKTSVTLACTDVAASVATAPLKAKRTGERLGTIHLKRDTCNRYWGYLKLNEPLGDWDSRATAGLFWETELGAQPGITCNSPGGNGFIQPGQTSCYTRRVSWEGVFAFTAFGHEDFNHMGEGWQVIADGKTRRVAVRS